ncbi:hypothetical protein CPB84DRAFT_1755824 [Gymnopilus junonius]|uniref:Uncharacterized protein n=1 Tax=Gymnopilus junonius TaxID=109634 RepID=A0A9P5N765_GYMJU|nr:hypothetical protein CPB84DRAFT_1755824 [Gymnopilus junonius]
MSFMKLGYGKIDDFINWASTFNTIPNYHLLANMLVQLLQMRLTISSDGWRACNTKVSYTMSFPRRQSPMEVVLSPKKEASMFFIFFWNVMLSVILPEDLEDIEDRLGDLSESEDPGSEDNYIPLEHEVENISNLPSLDMVTPEMDPQNQDSLSPDDMNHKLELELFLYMI